MTNYREKSFKAKVEDTSRQVCTVQGQLTEKVIMRKYLILIDLYDGSYLPAGLKNAVYYKTINYLPSIDPRYIRRI